MIIESNVFVIKFMSFLDIIMIKKLLIYLKIGNPLLMNLMGLIEYMELMEHRN